MSVVYGPPYKRGSTGIFEAGTYARPCARFEGVPTGTDDYRDDLCLELAVGLAAKWAGSHVCALYEVCPAKCTMARTPAAEPVHYVVAAPDGKHYVDIYGFWDGESLTAYWHELQVHMSLGNLPYHYVLQRYAPTESELAGLPATFDAVVYTIACAAEAALNEVYSSLARPMGTG